MIEFVLPYQGAYNLLLDLSYKAKAFVQSSVAPEEKRENLKIAISCELPFELVENIIY